MAAGNADIRKILVANRGEIARRVFATCRRMGIATVAVHSDADAGAPFVAEADEAVPLGGTTAAESYLRVDALLAAAERTGADAVHPGYGFLAESAELARAVAAAGLTWIGPSPEAIEAMGSKVRARTMMAEAGVPVLPGVELGDGANPGREAERLGFPLLVKASAGGGGKGMRAVEEPARLEDAVAGARREAAAAFGDGTVFLERLLLAPRHVEIQVFADDAGNTVSLGERECSIQRRHQKVVEETPSPAVDEELRARMGEAAVRAAEAVGYRGAGTVEFLLSADGEFFFLEMNTRLQVEHPVTEMVTGLDLVRLQIEVARGAPLPAEAREPALRGHAIEVRLYAEDPATDFLPQTGVVEALAFADAEPFAAPGAAETTSLLRLDSGVEAGSVVSPHYDPLLAKLVAWAPSRREAAAVLAAALRTAPVHGLLTNRDFLVRVLDNPAFLAGETDTDFIEAHRGDGLAEPLVDEAATGLHALVAALAGMRARRENGAVWGFAPPGWRNNPSGPQRVVFRSGGREVAVAYRVGRGEVWAEVDGAEVEGLRLHPGGPTRLDLEAGGVRRAYTVASYGDDVRWINGPLGQSALAELPRYPDGDEAAAEGALLAPMPGKVIRLAASEGSELTAGEPVVVLEAMKMEHELAAPASGVLTELRVSEGEQVESGAVLGVIEDGFEAPT